MEFNDHAERAGTIGALNWPWRGLCPQHLTCDTVSSKRTVLKLTLNKGITARRLNQKTGVPYSESETSIPFGAILTYKGSDRELEKFLYMSELFRCPRDVLASAVDGGNLPNLEEGIEEAPAALSDKPIPAKAPEATLKFEKLSAAPYSVARAKVPGGWLIVSGNSSVAFYPDAEHAWNGESL
jgi:hypothetical protein